MLVLSSVAAIFPVGASKITTSSGGVSMCRNGVPTHVGSAASPKPEYVGARVPTTSHVVFVGVAVRTPGQSTVVPVGCVTSKWSSTSRDGSASHGPKCEQPSIQLKRYENVPPERLFLRENPTSSPRNVA